VAIGAFAVTGACGDESQPSAGSGGTSGTGGTSAGSGGTSASTGGTSAGASGSGGSGDGGLPLECSGTAPGSGGGSSSPRERMEGVQCYVADATNGAPECLAADDPTLVSRVSDTITSCGFAVEFVIGAAESQPVLAGCDDLVECCASITPDWRSAECLDTVDAPQRQATCAAALESHVSQSQCTGPGSGDAGADAGADSGVADAGAPSSRYALCCYRICGFSVCT